MSDLSILQFLKSPAQGTLLLPREVPCPFVRNVCADNFCEAPETRNEYINRYHRPCHADGKCIALIVASASAAQELRVLRIARFIEERGPRAAERVFDLI